MAQYNRLVKSTGFSWEMLEKVINESEVASYFEALMPEKNIVKICELFLKLLREASPEDESIFVFIKAGILLVFLERSTTFNVMRFDVMEAALKHAKTVDPIFVYNLMEQLMAIMDTKNLEALLNFLAIAKRIQFYRLGKVLSVCLCWHIISDVSNVRHLISMHRYRSMEELMEMLPNVDEITQKAKWPLLFVYISAVTLLFRLLRFSLNKYLREGGYPDEFFIISSESSTKLVKHFVDIEVALVALNEASEGDDYNSLCKMNLKMINSDLMGAIETHTEDLNRRNKKDETA